MGGDRRNGMIRMFVDYFSKKSYRYFWKNQSPASYPITLYIVNTFTYNGCGKSTRVVWYVCARERIIPGNERGRPSPESFALQRCHGDRGEGLLSSPPQFTRSASVRPPLQRDKGSGVISRDNSSKTVFQKKILLNIIITAVVTN